MPLINLIEEQRLTNKRSGQRTRLFFFGFAGAIVVSLGLVGFFTLEGNRLEAEEHELLRLKQKLEPMVSQIEKAEGQIMEMQPKLVTLQGAQEGTGKWSRILDRLSRSFPANCYLTSVRCSQTDPQGPISVTLTGVSATQEAVGELLSRIQTISDFKKVDLKYTQGKLLDNRQAIEFQLVAEIGAPEQDKPKNEAGGPREAA